MLYKSLGDRPAQPHENRASMNERQKLFVKHYLIEPNATKAAIAAGYSERTARKIGSRLLTNVDVKAELEQKSTKRAQKLDISAEYVLETVHETVERCRQVRPVLDKQGNPVFIETPSGEVAAAFVFNSRDVLKGCELLGKHLRIFGEEKAPTTQIIILTEHEKREAEQSLEKIQAFASKSESPLLAEFVEKGTERENANL